LVAKKSTRLIGAVYKQKGVLGAIVPSLNLVAAFGRKPEKSSAAFGLESQTRI
jgi:hypothetical protein